MTTTASPRHAAFTLVELIISAALMSIILGAAYACLTACLQGRDLVESRSDMAQNARVALGLIVADLRTATPLSPEFEFVGMDRTLGDAEADNLDFATHHYTPRHPREGDICEVSYFVQEDPEGGPPSLWRRRDASPDQEPLSGGDRELIAENISGVRFEYYDGFDWYDSWGDAEGKYKGMEALLLPSNAYGMPEAVRVTLYIRPESKPGAKPVSKTTEEPEPPLVFQTVVRLELAAASALSSESDTEGRSGANSGGNR